MNKFGNAGGGLAAAPKPKMTDEDIRLECMKLAVQSTVPPASVIKLAGEMFNFIKG